MGTDQGWYRSPVTLTFEMVNDWPGLTEYKLDGAAEWSRREYHYPPVTIKEEGIHALEYRSIDKLHNIEAPKSTTINIDLTPPTATHTLAGIYLPNGWYNPPVTVTLGGQDTLSGIERRELKLNGNGWQVVTASLVISAAGPHTLIYRVVDRAGNVSLEEIVNFSIEVEDFDVYLPLIVKL